MCSNLGYLGKVLRINILIMTFILHDRSYGPHALTSHACMGNFFAGFCLNLLNFLIDIKYTDFIFCASVL